MESLAVPQELCLVRWETAPPGRCGVAGACYLPESHEVWFYRGAPSGGEASTLAHERCHAHQHQVVLDAGFGDQLDRFFETTEGRAFVQALDGYKATLSGVYQGPGGGDLLEDHAQFCAGWYMGQYPATAQYPVIRDHAAEYWPR